MESKPAAQSFGDLVVWQKSVSRCAVSMPSNIAEGQGRMSTGEFRQFLGIARGSNFELQTQIEIARRLGLGDAKLMNEADELSHEVGKMLYAILDKVAH